MRKPIFFAAMLLVLIFQILSAQTQPKIITENSEIDTFKILQPAPIHQRVNTIVSGLLMRNHYKKTELNDSLSNVIYNNYIKSFDNFKVYFLQADIDAFSKSKDKIDDYLKAGNLQFAFEVFNVYKRRLNERMLSIKKLLSNEFDYTIDEVFIVDRNDAPWAKSPAELDELWRLRLKSDALNKKLNGESWDKISSSLFKRYQTFHKQILQYKAEDVFEIYMNAYTSAIDPHTDYFSPADAANFDITMSRSLEGIGAQLRNQDDYTLIVEVIPGGPADKSKNLFANDKIVAVAQGDTGEFVDVVGWRVDDVVQLIRGKKGTAVRLSVMRANATPDMPNETVKLVRDKVTLEEQSAKSKILYLDQDNKNYKIGIIDVPAFYVDFKGKARGEKDFKSTTRDVRNLLKDLKNDGVDGIVVDLRNNSGGSLQEAIELTGLFIKKGPVVQVRNSDQSIDLGDDTDSEIVYDGPLSVLVNRYSASASEIFSAAIQDYGRGLIIGEQTFGKGTVQNLIDLKRFLPYSEDKLGNLKLTIAKYYRINGNSTQKLGVIPDIQFPSIDRKDFGEESLPSSLPYDKIKSSSFQKFDNLSEYFSKLNSNYQQRIKNNLEFQYMIEDIDEYQQNSNKKEFSLNEATRKAEREKAELKKKEREEAVKNKVELKIVEKQEVNKSSEKIDDPQLEESCRILADFISMRVG